jgi:hypothetical protein
MSEPLLIIYSHSSFLDIIYITTDLLKSYKNKILLTDENFDKDDEYKNHYVNILKYKNKDTYATRLHLLEQVTEDYFIIMHEVDLLIKYNSVILHKMIEYMIENNVDNIELQHCAPPYHISKRQFHLHNPAINCKDICDIYKKDNIDMLAKGYNIFNVNPNIWKKSSLIKLMKKHSHLDYRTIEPNVPLAKDMANMNCYSLLVKNPINCGHFMCDEFFLPLHILRHCKIFDPKPMHTCGVELDKEVYKIYNEILNKYFIGKTKRRMIVGFPG